MDYSNSTKREEKVVTEPVTFRIDIKLRDLFRSLAEKEGISLNLFVNRIFLDFVEWSMVSHKSGFILIHQNIIKDLIESLDANTLQNIGSSWADEIEKDIAFQMKGAYNFDTWHSILITKVKKSGFDVNEYYNDNELVIAIKHCMGQNWSILCKSYNEKILHKLGKQVRFDSSANSLIFYIKLDNR